jgi:hypothetical protein
MYFDGKSLDTTLPVRSRAWSYDGDYFGGLMFTALWSNHDPTNGMPMPGDSGGPLFVQNQAGQWRVAGVHHGVDCQTGDIQAQWARTVGTPDQSGNIKFIQMFLGPDLSDYHTPGCDAGQGTDPNDTDCDWVANSKDNCPNDFNPDQIDTDGDRHGDACDTCPTTADDLSDLNVEAETVIARRNVPGYVGFGRTNITAANGLWNVSGTVANQLLSQNQKSFPADACDRAALVAPVNGIGGGLSIQTDGDKFGPNGLMDNGRVAKCTSKDQRTGAVKTFDCDTNSTAQIDYRPSGAFATTYNQSGGSTQAWRHCDCDSDDGDVCEAPPYNCKRDSTLFDSLPASGPGWHVVTVEDHNGNAVTDMKDPFGALGGPSYSARWMWWRDFANEGRTLPPLPGPGQSNEDVAHSHGRLWWFVSSYQGSRWSKQGVGTTLWSVFTSFSIRENNPQISAPLPPVASSGLKIFCKDCPDGTNIIGKYKNAVDPDPGALVAVTSKGTNVSISRQVSAAAAGAILQPGVTVIPAGESQHLIGASDASHVVLTPSRHVSTVLTTHPITGQLGTRTNVMTTMSDSDTTQPSTDLPGTNSAIAFSGRRNLLFAVANDDPNGLSVWTNNITIDTWAPLTLTSPLTNAIALTTSSDGLVFYALDLVADATGSATLRLVEIDPDTGVVNEMVRTPAPPFVDTYYLASDYLDNGLIIAATGPLGHTFIRTALSDYTTSTGLQVTAAPGAIVSAPYDTPAGIAWGSTDDLGNLTSNVTTPSEFVTVF